MADAEGVPPYASFTNDQLAEMVQRRVCTAAALREVPGIGEGVEKYGKAFLEVLKQASLPVQMPGLHLRWLPGGAKARRRSLVSDLKT